MSQHWSMLGREDLSAGTGYSEYRTTACATLPGNVEGIAPVIAQIADAARKHRIVIVNESHVVTRHRDFTRRLLTALRPQGFTVLAAETFVNLDGRADPVEVYGDLPYLDRRLGHYSKEPVFGRMLRDAKALGYRFAAYEQVFVPSAQMPTDIDLSIAQREAAQAQNLATIIEAMGPDEKLIIHVGYSHARETPVVREDGYEEAWMAARLKRLTGLDPLTVSQTTCRGGGPQTRLAALAESHGGSFDLVVDHPVESFTFGKPQWRFDGLQMVEIPDSLRPADAPVVIEVFADGEPFDAVPYDRVYAEPGDDLRLALPSGRYTVRAIRLPKVD